MSGEPRSLQELAADPGVDALLFGYAATSDLGVAVKLQSGQWQLVHLESGADSVVSTEQLEIIAHWPRTPLAPRSEARERGGELRKLLTSAPDPDEYNSHFGFEATSFMSDYAAWRKSVLRRLARGKGNP